MEKVPKIFSPKVVNNGDEIHGAIRKKSPKKQIQAYKKWSCWPLLKKLFFGPKKEHVICSFAGGMHQPVWVILQFKPIWVKVAIRSIRLYKYFYASGKS